MPRVCTICSHRDIIAINQALIASESIQSIANRFEVSFQALKRHKSAHLPTTLAKAQQAAEVASAGTLLEQVEALRDKALTLLAAAEEAGDLRTALAGVREARSCIELLAEIEGELDRGPTVNVIASPEWRMVLATVIEALAPYPDARVAAANAVLALGDGT